MSISIINKLPMRLNAIINVVLLESITEHQSPFSYIQLDSVASILISNKIGEGGSHGGFLVDSYSINTSPGDSDEVWDSSQGVTWQE